MRNFQDTLETRKRSFISTFSICMTVPLIKIFMFNSLQTEPPEMFYKKRFSEKISQISQENSCAGLPILIKLQASDLQLY